MTIYDGVVNLDDQQVAVIVGFEEDGIRMSSGGAEIGEWPDGEYSIDHNGGGIYTITAESESLQFVPNNPSLFAAQLTGTISPLPAYSEPETEPNNAALDIEAPAPIDRAEAPPPKPLTRVVFYALAGITATLGLWALVSLFAA